MRGTPEKPLLPAESPLVLHLGKENIAITDKATLAVGGLNKQQILRGLERGESEGLLTTDQARRMVESAEFTPSLSKERIGLISVRVADLGFTAAPNTQQLFQRIKELGLQLVPQETAAQLALQKKDQLGRTQRLTFGMGPIADADGAASVFYLESIDGVMELGGRWADSEALWPTETHLVLRFSKHS